MPKMLDLFCGRFGWGRSFAERGWHVVGIDLVEPPPGTIPEGNISFHIKDILLLTPEWIKSRGFDFICASSPCEGFSKFGLRCFYPDPLYPEMGIRLFNNTRSLCEASGLPYVMENVRAAQQFVGVANHHCGPFYLWGNAVPPLMPQGIRKGFNRKRDPLTGKPSKEYAEQTTNKKTNGLRGQQIAAAVHATIPPELSSCIADYAESLTQQHQ
jgi:hypothetical protein